MGEGGRDMSVAIGDIVETNGELYVVAGFFKQPNGPRMNKVARLVRKNSNGTTTSFTIAPEGVDLIESPVFEPGARVTVDGLPGAVVETIPDEGIVNVLLDARTKPLKGGDNLQIDPSISRQFLWRLVLENKL
ncbi:hypothetical protein [Mesorhizobium sp. CN2-181]|uniref:hypothetical protein n=1 Tax=Mesorhizobium yinganensis TaxID=3157707 RepID=UPI0032B76CDC